MKRRANLKLPEWRLEYRSLHPRDALKIIERLERELHLTNGEYYFSTLTKPYAENLP